MFLFRRYSLGDANQRVGGGDRAQDEFSSLNRFEFKVYNEITHRNKGWIVVTIIEVYMHITLSWLLGCYIVVTHCNRRISAMML